ncbi:RICIN domain-containing protein [uncultured Croceitalea sp.]|uniref:RICIN domain-containing protein n=1 Tax=uncultured Croceitalea sp. TaxID=1798908 RepID=UPI0033064579
MKNYYLLIVLVLFTLVCCTDETTVYDLQDQGRALLLEENNTILQNSIASESNGILPIYFVHEDYDESGIDKNGSLSLKAPIKNRTTSTRENTSNASSDFHLNLVGQVSSPSFEGGSNLTATHVDYQDQFAYVSYNTIGETFAGAVDVIDLSDPLSPVLASRMYMYNRDANVIFYDSGYVYVLGNVDTEKVLEATGESFIAKIGVQDGSIDLNNLTYFYQQGNTATGITKMGNSFYVSSGTDGVIAKYDGATFSKSNEIAFDDLRSVTSENGKLAVLDASTGVTIMDGELNVISTINTSTSLVEDAKRTIAIMNGKLIVAEGAQGAGVYNLDTGTLEERLAILIDPENISPSDKVTNAVSVNGNATLLANGGAGLAIKVKNELIDLMGVVELNGSINYVISDGDYIFAASGNSGLQIINKIRTDESTVIPEGNYLIKARHSGRVIGLSSLSTADGTNISQESRDGQGDNEQWNLEILDSGAYVIRSLYSDKVAQKSETSGTANNVLQSEYVGDISQQWAIEPAADEGYFYIRNLDDNQYMDVFGRRTSAGTNIITWPFHGRNNQQWQLEVIEQ